MPMTVQLSLPRQPHFLETPWGGGLGGGGVATGRLGPGHCPAWSRAQSWWAGGAQGPPATLPLGFVMSPQVPQPQHPGVSWVAEALSPVWQALGQGFLGTCSETVSTAHHTSPGRGLPGHCQPLVPALVVPWAGWPCVPCPLEQSG